PGIVGAVLGELHAEAVEGALVQAGEEALHHLAGLELEAAQGLDVALLDGHGAKFGKEASGTAHPDRAWGFGMDALPSRPQFRELNTIPSRHANSHPPSA